MGITMEELRESQRARGPATILAIGTAVPDHYICQADYPDYYFRLTSSEHMTKLKEKFTRICQKTMIRKRHFVLTEELLKDSPMDICSHDSPSLNVRQDIMVDQLPRLGAEAASNAIDEWGQPKSKITHLVFCATVAGELPGTDYKLVKLLGLNPTVKRVMLYQQGCFSGGSVLRIAKDLAENNANARVLVVCSQSTAILFRGPSERSLGSLVGQAIFGDGASSVIIGSDPREPVERPIFQIVFTAETIIPDSGDSITAQLCEAGLVVDLSERVPYLLSENIERIIADAFNPIGIDDWNSIFWAPHPGGPKILDQVEAKFGLNKDKFRASRHILGEYGNMSSVCVLFILDEIRKRSKEEKRSTTGEGLEWGVLLGFGPGITVETIVLRSIPT